MSPNKRFLEDENQALSPVQEEFARLLEAYDYAFKRGDIVKGTVVELEPNGALVDIGAKMAAFLPNKEIPNLRTGPGLQPGEEHEFFIVDTKNEDGQLSLSLKRVQAAQNWKKLEDLMAAETVVECTVTSVVKGGLLVEIFGLRGFIPSSHLRIKNQLEELVGQTLPAKIINLDKQRNNIILSHRKMVSEQMAEQRRDLFGKITEGDVIEGEVVRLTDFGAFIDLGGVDGLLPLSQMSWRWVEHPSDILSIGEKVKVEVIGVDMDKQRVSLSIKGQTADPWEEVVNKLAQGDEVEGTITRMKHFGAFVEVYPGVEALLPNRDIMEYEHHNQSKLAAGQKVKTYIIKFSPEERRISLSFMPLRMPNQAQTADSTN
ncbi:MAG: S1 RNA-binding domain-containing protein [Vampirovibrionales bacterium]|nr:S1 RNA-binding domain-containing protein [Vampirovibrionales bacterium]